ncbi:MAG TPA: hypothetical protein VFM55_18455 [Micromonosporaceae bacterium]|nr:hypothetical protein [Micromonosporaceae bacterium]
MKSRRLAAIGVSALAALSFAIAGCDATGGGTGGATPTTAAPSSPEPEPKEALAKAVTELSKTSFKVNMGIGPLRSTGAMDPGAQQGQLSMAISTGAANVTIETVLSGPDMWVKAAGIPGSTDKWMHLDTSKLPANSALGVRPGQLDPAGAQRLVGSIATVERTGPGRYTGTLDLTKAVDQNVVGKSTLDELGDRAKAVPFEATVDAQGRLTNLKLSLGTIQGIPTVIDVTYSDFGTPVSVTKPAPAEVVEAPPAVYQLLGSG